GALNDRMARVYGTVGVRLTATCAELDLARSVVRYAAAAHPAPCAVRRGEVVELESGGTFIGLLPGVAFPEWEAPFGEGDAFYLFTDGIAEQPGLAGEAFGTERLYDAIGEASARGVPAGGVVLGRLDAFAGDRPPYDDITLVGAC